MSTNRVTIIVAPREGSNVTQESREGLYDNTAPPFDLIYVNGKSPSATANHLKGYSATHGFLLERRDHHVTPNQAPNIGLARAETENVAFADNDLIFSQGWFDALVRCADETGAIAVAPLQREGFPPHRIVHHTSGEVYFEPISVEPQFIHAKKDCPISLIGHLFNEGGAPTGESVALSNSMTNGR